MPEFESSPNLNNLGLNHNEVGVGPNVREKPDSKLSLEELEKLKAEEGQVQEVEKPELSPEEQIEQTGENIIAKQEEIAHLSELIESTKSEVNAAREKLSLPPTEEEPPSVFLEKDRLEKLQAEQGALEKQRKELISQQEKERLIIKEKEKILQEKLDELFKEFKALSPSDFESIFMSGKTSKGHNVESKSMGSLDPKVAQSLAEAFKKGIKLLPKILETLPELLKKFDGDLTEEATKRVEQKLEEEKQRMEEGRKKEEKLGEPKPEEKLEVSEGEIPPSKIKSGPSPIVGGDIETPKA